MRKISGFLFALLALLLASPSILIAQTQAAKENNQKFPALISRYESIEEDKSFNLEISSEVARVKKATEQGENPEYEIDYIFKNKGGAEIKLLILDLDLLIYALPLETRDFSIILKPGETKNLKINLLKEPKVLRAGDAMTVWRESLSTWDSDGFVLATIYAPDSSR